ncbi:MAG: MCP four helix bundle domain-containing protein, partial [Desulfuromonadaceae bacterium]
MKIFAKLIAGFAAVALLCIAVGTAGWLGLNSVDQSLMDVSKTRLPAVQYLGNMDSTMNAVISAERTLLLPSLTYRERTEEIDNLKKLWQNFDSELNSYLALPKNAEETSLTNRFKQQLEQWKSEHGKLLALVQRVELDDVQHVEASLVARKLDHVKWVAALDQAIANRRHFDRQLDPTLCGLGKWLSTFSSEDDEFNAVLAKFEPPHQKLHGLGQKINELMAENNVNGAKKLFSHEVEPTLQNMESIFTEAQEIAANDIKSLRAAAAIAFGTERETFAAAMQTIDELIALNNQLTGEVSQTAEADADASKLTALIMTLLAAVLAMALGFFLSRSIVEPLKKVM